MDWESSMQRVIYVWHSGAPSSFGDDMGTLPFKWMACAASRWHWIGVYSVSGATVVIAMKAVPPWGRAYMYM